MLVRRRSELRPGWDAGQDWVYQAGTGAPRKAPRRHRTAVRCRRVSSHVPTYRDGRHSSEFAEASARTMRARGKVPRHGAREHHPATTSTVVSTACSSPISRSDGTAGRVATCTFAMAGSLCGSTTATGYPLSPTPSLVNAPARGYSWPPFAPGNTAALRHGARSPRVLRPIVERLTAELADVAPWSRRPAYAGEVKAWAWAEARCVVLRDWIDEHGVLSEKGMLAAGELARAEARAASGRDRLGLSPLALAKLLGAFNAAPAGTDDDRLEALKAEGRRIVEARAAALAEGADANVAALASQAAENGRGTED